MKSFLELRYVAKKNWTLQRNLAVDLVNQGKNESLTIQFQTL